MWHALYLHLACLHDSGALIRGYSTDDAATRCTVIHEFDDAFSDGDVDALVSGSDCEHGANRTNRDETGTHDKGPRRVFGHLEQSLAGGQFDLTACLVKAHGRFRCSIQHHAGPVGELHSPDLAQLTHVSLVTPVDPPRACGAEK